MPYLTAANVMKDGPALSPTDTVGRALLLLRRYSLPALPVVWEGRPVGVFSEACVLALTENAWNDEQWEMVRQLPVGKVMAPSVNTVNADTALAEVAHMLRTYPDACLAVVDGAGYYRGLVCRQDVVAALCNVVSPGTVGGMATPLGVYLTNGVVRAGAGNLGLFLAGVFLAFLWMLSTVLISGICWAVQEYSPLPLLAIRLSEPTPANAIYFSLEVWSGIFFVAQLVFFFLLMRLFPLSGTHGAEHQVVHAIEAGEELTPETVYAHTTVHPRCGTNLAAMMLILGVGISYFTSIRIEDPVSIAMYIFIVLFLALWLRRPVGAFIQGVVTTRKPSQKQLLAAIQVGNELLEKCRYQTGKRPEGFKRLWNMGLLQVLTGAGLTNYGIILLQTWLGARWLVW